MEARPVEPLGLCASDVNGDRNSAAGEGKELSITVVVATFNSADHVDDCLRSVRCYLPGAQTIVVDNDSSDGTAEQVRERFPQTIVLAGHGNVGFGGACNLGAQRATGDYLLYLNPDAELVEADLQELVHQTQAPRFGILAGSLLDGGFRKPLLRRSSRHWPVEMLGAHVLAILSPLAPPPRHVERADRPGLYTVSGAALMVRTREFRALGGFDERFFMYYEDTDLTQRYRKQGYPLRVSSTLAIRHIGGTSAPVPRRNALSFLGWLEYLAKWRGPGVARRAALAAKIAYSVVLGLLAPFGEGRARAKAEELEAMLSHIALAGAEVPSASANVRSRGTLSAREGADGWPEPSMRYPVAAPIAKRCFRSHGLDA
jgi:GT2 family glycosyltransferase